jgi:hypothetical protein
MAESVEGGMQCARGPMGLARELEQRLRECCVLQTRTPRDTVFIYGGKPHAIDGDWFCPRCGVAAAQSTPCDLRRPACLRSLVEFVHSLTELHPHCDGVSGWR